MRAYFLMGILLTGRSSACDTAEDVCTNVITIGYPNCVMTTWKRSTCPPDTELYTRVAIRGPTTCECEPGIYTSPQKDVGTCSFVSQPYHLAAVTNLVGCDANPCQGCGGGRYWGGTPSCDRCKNGCDVRCGFANIDDGCVPCPNGAFSGEVRRECGDKEATLSLGMEVLVDKVTQAFCLPGSGSAGYGFLGAMFATIDYNGDGDISCEEYRMLKMTPMDGRRRHKGLTKLPKPSCTLSNMGRVTLKDYNAYLKKYFYTNKRSQSSYAKHHHHDEHKHKKGYQ